MSLTGDDLSGMSDRLDGFYEDLLGEDDDPLEEWSARTIVTTMLPLLAALSVLQMVSGSVLQTFEETLLAYPSLLVLVPVQIGTAGNLASIMCARLSTQLHLGTFELDPSNPDVRANTLAILGLAATVFLAVGIAAWAIGRVLDGSLGFLEVLTISMVSGMALAVLVVVLSVLSVWGSFRLGYNPDDTTIPIVTNVCDIVGVLILFAVASVVI
ncbi:magnesium transporter [Halalkalicoccus sp. NIPERK01]|nr:magnesium transporter [Halalkalicoccus sp. NIPERK01]